ncbi:DUF4365 domain-containing protein [Actinomadura citrea]|uniref:Tetratricopeptide (TPR) repeat protein n=1 Tax=Actinomadura citrea TaxID=46158 RepID=A0A7Y9KCA8_9ACTN|nr:DUF4365 domain-containing protein [Actinomadura citrea]NYE12190.1 tetratricopeptide (TPR) repeat protein [Actinomadura citrea]GGT50172.1 hypothetical protein GCM10010177_02450 [Actinomadura citrea]
MAEDDLDPDLTGEAAVHIVGQHVLTRLKWIYRAEPILDYGIDAQVEIKTEGRPTGRLLALQIKGGPSWFQEPTESGWIFRPKPRNVEYWLGHILPVFVVIVDLNSNIAYWEQVTSQTIESTGKGYKMTVPRDQVLNTAGDQWLSIVQDNTVKARERYTISLECLPPAVGEILEESKNVKELEVALLAHELSQGRSNPSFTVKTLLAATPSWLEGIGFDGWRAVATYASEHGCTAESVAALERAVALKSTGTGRVLAVAGLQLISVDRTKARAYLDRAALTSEGALVAGVGHLLLEEDESTAKPIPIPSTLDIASKDADSEPVVQEILALNARRSNNESEAIQRYSRALELRPTASNYMTSLAESYARRATTAESRPTDISQSKKWALQALQQRRKWSGDSIGALQLLLSALALQGDFEQVVKHGRPLPFGDATLEESKDAVVAGKVLYAARMLNKESIVSEVLESIEGQEGAELLKLEFADEDLSPEEKAELWKITLKQAQDKEDYELTYSAVLMLAFQGIDTTVALDGLVERGIVSSTKKAVASTLIDAHADFDSTLPQLQSLADSDPIAAEYLISRLVDRGQLDKANTACVRAYDRLHIPELLVKRVEILRRAGLPAEAESSALRALAEPALAGFQRAKLYVLLASLASERKDWALAERYLRSRLDLLDSPDTETVWNLVRMQLNQRRDGQAAETISAYGMVPKNEDEARCWFRSFVAKEWDNATTSQALTLATQFSDDVELSSALLRHVIFSTRSVDESGDGSSDQDSDVQSEKSVDARSVVDPELRRAAFAALAEAAEEHGPDSQVRFVPFSPEDLAAQMEADASSRDLSPLKETLASISDGRFPLGMFAAITGRSYALIVIQQQLGMSIASAMDDVVHQIEVESARRAFGNSVVTEASALLLSSKLNDIQDIRGRFSEILMAESSRDDIARATAEARGLTASSGTLAWSEELNRPIFHESTPRERSELWRKAEALDGSARNTTLEQVGDLSLFQQLDEMNFRPWLAPIELAHQREAFLWSDDLALRHLARSVGVQAFGTISAIEAIVESEISISAERGLDRQMQEWADLQARLVRRCLEESVVDIPVDLDDLIDQIRNEKGASGGAAALQLTRAAWWRWRNNPLEDLRRIYEVVSSYNVDLLRPWQVSAMRGVASAWGENPDAASTMLTLIAIFGVGSSPSVDDAHAGIQQAIALAQNLNLPSPGDKVPIAANILSRMQKLDDPDEFIRAVLAKRQ